jgi:hypothetical protein
VVKATKVAKTLSLLPKLLLQLQLLRSLTKLL